THRDHASLITIATGHQARPAPDAEPTVPALPWSALACQGGTLVFLMGMRQLPLIMTKLMEHGLARDTPAAVVERGTTGRQRTVVATVATLAERVRGAGLGPPGVVVVGKGVGVRELAQVRLAAIGPETAAELGRRHLRPDVVPAEYRAEGLVEALAGEDLRGRRFLLPRAAGARAVLPEALAARGALVEEVMAYEAVLPRDADVDGLRAALAAVAVDAIAFTSSSTVRNFVTLLGA